MWGNKSAACWWPRFAYWASLLAASLLFPQLVGADQAGKSRPLIEKLPLSFELNQGQTDPRVKFLSRGNGYALFLTPSEMVLGLTRPDTQATGVLRMRLSGANQEPQISGTQELPGKVNYLIGNDASQWRAGVPTYARVEYGAVYPGIDLVYYGNGRTIEYDFVVAPGADPEVIGFAVEGAEKLALDSAGDLVLQMAGGELRMRKPVVYQEVDGVRTPIDGHYVLKGANQVGFQLAAYDASKELVIDPVLVYSTFLGGSGTDEGLAIAADGAGNVYVTGSTQSSNFPLMGAISTSLGGNTDAFITKFSSTGGVLFSTYFGGGGPDQGRGIAVDGSSIYVTGFTQSSNFPTTAGAYTASSAGSIDAFVTKFNATGNAIVYSTFLGGKNVDQGNAIAVRGGKIYVTGSTTSGGKQNPFPTTSNAYGKTYNGRRDTDAFVSVLNPTAVGPAQLVYSTFLGTNGDDAGNGIAVDSTGNYYVTGSTGANAFLAKFSATDVFQYNPSLGIGVGNGVAVGSAVYVTGASGTDAFVAKRSTATGAALVFPNPNLVGAVGKGIALDDSGNAYVTGSASGGIGGAIDAPFVGGASDAFVAKFSGTTGARTYFTYLGGNASDAGNGIAVKANGAIAYVVGTTGSANFPTFAAAYPGCGAGSTCSNTLTDAFVTAIQFDTTPPEVTINQAVGQPDPTKISPINFTVVFSEPVTGFDASDVTIVGAGGIKTVVVSPALDPSILTYNVAVSGMTSSGTVTASIAAGTFTDLAGNANNASTTDDNMVTWSNEPPIVSLTMPVNGSTVNATPTFAGNGGTIAGDLDPITVKIYSGPSASGAPAQMLTTARGASGAYSVTVAPATPLPNGTHTAKAQQSDVLGNTGFSLTSTFTVDGALPTFGPVSNLLFQTGTQFSFPKPVAFDNAPLNPDVTCTVPGSQEVTGDTNPATFEYTTGSSGPFPLGDTTVTCTATDTAGNVGSVQFIVTVTLTAPPTLGLTVPNLTVAQGAPITLAATISVNVLTLTIAPDCVNTTWTIKRLADGSVVPPRHRERIYGIPDDLVTLDPSAPKVIGCDASEAVDPALLPPGQYKFFATYSNYITDDPDELPAYDIWTGSISSEEANLTIEGSSMRVGVDIKPGNTQNSWNCSSQGQGTQIAVVSGEIFDPSGPAPTYRRMFNPVAEVDVASVRFGKIGNEVSYNGSPSTSDVNGDGVPDLVFHFSIKGTDFEGCADIPVGQQDATVIGIVTGTTKVELGGAAFSGSDSIRLVTGSNQ